MHSMLILSDTQSTITPLLTLAAGRGDMLVETLPSIPETHDTDVQTVLLDADLLARHGDPVEECVDRLLIQYPHAVLIIIASAHTTHVAVDAVQAGAFSYLTQPVNREELELVLERFREQDILQSELDYLRDQFWSEDFQEVIDTRNSLMRDLFEQIRHVSSTRTTVLLTGETGTGKTLIAKMIHAHSARRHSSFISLHCGAIPDTLVESEFFGHEKGAFTGATQRVLGKFELAQGGTIFLDEIGTINQSTQVKLLDVLQSRSLRRLGGKHQIPVDVRVIAATNDDLDQLCTNGLFRRDLYYRLNVFPMHLPPLRERKEDLLRISEAFLKRFNHELNQDIKALHPDVMNAFMAYDWPGNIRELENIIERACILEQSSVLTMGSIPMEFQGSLPSPSLSTAQGMKPLSQARKEVVDGFERLYLQELLSRHAGRMKQAAQDAEITTRQLNKLMLKHGISRKTFLDPDRPGNTS